MREKKEIITFRSGFGPVLDRFIRFKRACGYRYSPDSARLRCLDNFLYKEGWHSDEFPRELLKKWMERKDNERPRNQDGRKSAVRQICLFLQCQGDAVDTSFIQQNGRFKRDFIPRIFTYDEIRSLLRAVDGLQYTIHSPMRHLIMPEYFRLLYFCGLRSGEARCMRLKDVDLERGLLTIRDGKGGKDRLVPLAGSIVRRLQKYAMFLTVKSPNAFFFPAPDGGQYGRKTVYDAYREVLRKAGIPHGGRGKGPRAHDLRHTYAVHRLIQWYREGADLNKKLSVLADYMGHETLEGTQYYLHFTADLFPELTKRTEKAFGHIIPRRQDP